MRVGQAGAIAQNGQGAQLDGLFATSTDSEGALTFIAACDLPTQETATVEVRIQFCGPYFWVPDWVDWYDLVVNCGN